MHRLQILTMLAWRNLWRNHRRTAIMLGAISVGAWAMIFMTALTQGMVNEMIRDGISALPGHVQVHHPDYRDDPNITNLLPASDAEIAATFAPAGFTAWSSRIKVPAVITSEYDSRGVTLLGIDPARERGMIFVDYNAVEGRFLESVDDSGVVIGQKLADTLETGVGKRIVLMSQDPDNDIADRGFRVVGLFHANVEAFEETYVFAAKHTIQEMLDVGDKVTEIVVLGDHYRDVEAEYARVAELAGPGVEVLRWTELDTYLGTMLSVMDGFVLIWVIVIFLALSFGLVNTLVMAVFERVREIGLMLALGMKPGNILGQILIESMLLLVIGLGIGNLLAWLTIKPLESGIDISIVAEGMAMMGASSMLYPQLRLEDVVLANVVVLILGFLASLSPAWRASRYEPIEAITKVDG
jgi:ABC-type lipoprotein release transport system permease subunit